MIKVTLIVLGGLKEKYFMEAAKEYEKRLSRFCELKTVEITPVSLPDNPSKSEIDKALQKEAELIFKKIPQNSEIVAMCIEGKNLSSEELSSYVSKQTDFGTGNIVFIIGSSFGLSNAVKEKANLKLSMSKMTFPHKLARVMLLEQIYRAFMISSGGEYHK